MRNLDLALSDGHEPLLGQPSEHFGHTLVAPAPKFGQWHAPAHGRLALAGEPQQEPAGEQLPVRVEPFVRALGQPGHRPVHAAGVLVGAHSQGAAVTALPQLQQRGGQQRQRPGFALDVGDESVDELGLHPQAGTARRQLDRAAQLAMAHRPDQDVVGAEHA